MNMSLPIKDGWHNALKRAGITRRIRPYDLRHAFASLALMHGADIKSVAETMGHRGITMLLTVYQHTRFDQRRRAVNAAPGLFSSSGVKEDRKKRISGRGGGDWSLPHRPGVRSPDHGPTRCCNHRARFPPAVVLVTSAQHITGREPGCNM